MIDATLSPYRLVDMRETMRAAGESWPIVAAEVSERFAVAGKAEMLGAVRAKGIHDTGTFAESIKGESRSTGVSVNAAYIAEVYSNRRAQAATLDGGRVPYAKRPGRALTSWVVGHIGDLRNFVTRKAKRRTRVIGRGGLAATDAEFEDAQKQTKRLVFVIGRAIAQRGLPARNFMAETVTAVMADVEAYATVALERFVSKIKQAT